MNPNTILYIITSIIILDFLLDQVIDYLNYKRQDAAIPQELQGIYDDEKLNKSRDYQKANTKFGFVTATFSFLLMLGMITSGAFGKISGELNKHISDPIFLALSFFGLLFIASDILNLPFSLYKTFVIEEKFDFNKTTIKIFVMDKLKGYLLGAIFGGIILYILLFMILKIGSGFWIYFWIVISIFILLINMFYTSLIVPLFNKLKALEEGSLKTAIEDYSKKVKFPLDNIFVIDGSKRSSKANAFFSGIGKKKKIVLYDTLINNHSTDELVAVLAHEVGHFKKKHIITGYILSIIQTGVMLFILSLFVFNENISRALGAESLAIHINLIAFGILYTPISHLTSIAMNIISRKNEYEADAYAATTYNSGSLQTALKKLSVNNLSNLNPHPAYVFLHYSHPPLLLRLKNLLLYKDPS